MILDTRKIRKQMCDIHVSQSGYFSISPEGSTDTIATGTNLHQVIEQADKVLRRAMKMRLWIPFTDMATWEPKAVTGIHGQNGDFMVYNIRTEETTRVPRYSLHRGIAPLEDLSEKAIEVREKLEKRRTKIRALMEDCSDRIKRWNEKYEVDVRSQVETAIREWEDEHPEQNTQRRA